MLIIIDLRALTFIDIAGLREILGVEDRARHTGHRVVLVRGPAQVDRVFTLAGVNDRLRTIELTPFDPPTDRSGRLDAPRTSG